VFFACLFPTLAREPRQTTFRLRSSSPLNAMFTRTGLISTLAAATAIVEGVTIADIQGNSFVSTYNGKTVQDLVGVVTAKV
jgi:hypothetical protein